MRSGAIGWGPMGGNWRTIEAWVHGRRLGDRWNWGLWDKISGHWVGANGMRSVGAGPIGGSWGTNGTGGLWEAIMGSIEQEKWDRRQWGRLEALELWVKMM